MNFNRAVLRILQLTLLLMSCHVQSQDDITSTQPVDDGAGKGFHLGLYVGTYFANKYSTNMYDGYGLDVNGARNNFANSLLYNQIVNYYGGGNGGQDLIAQILNVNHNEWSFNESGMPIDMRYNITYLVGLNTRYNLNKKEAIIFNLNGTKLTVNGDFTINTSVISSGIQGPTMVHPFSINGSEERLMFQLGYQRMLGDNDKLNFFIEGGFDFTLVKYLKNRATINNNTTVLQIDLANVYNQPAYNYVRSKYFVGIGPGVFAGLGLNLSINPKYTVQLLYTPAYDMVKLGVNPAFKLQNSVGFRAYYNL